MNNCENFMLYLCWKQTFSEMREDPREITDQSSQNVDLFNICFTDLTSSASQQQFRHFISRSQNCHHLPLKLHFADAGRPNRRANRGEGRTDGRTDRKIKKMAVRRGEWALKATASPSFLGCLASERLLSLYFYTPSINRPPQTHLCSLTKWHAGTHTHTQITDVDNERGAVKPLWVIKRVWTHSATFSRLFPAVWSRLIFFNLETFLWKWRPSLCFIFWGHLICFTFDFIESFYKKNKTRMMKTSSASRSLLSGDFWIKAFYLFSSELLHSLNILFTRKLIVWKRLFESVFHLIIHTEMIKKSSEIITTEGWRQLT